MKVKLAYIIVGDDNNIPTVTDIKGFNTKKGAQEYDKLLKKHFGESVVLSKIIYDEEKNKKQD